eukprot:3731789-Alexandrium_andersonii.AAC.1
MECCTNHGVLQPRCQTEGLEHPAEPDCGSKAPQARPRRYSVRSVRCPSRSVPSIDSVRSIFTER